MKNKIGSNAPWKSTTICIDTETNTKTRWYIPLELSFIKKQNPKRRHHMSYINDTGLNEMTS